MTLHEDKMLSSLFQHPEPLPPASEPPDLGRLGETLRRRRTRRRCTVGLGGLFAACLVAFMVTASPRASSHVEQAGVTPSDRTTPVVTHSNTADESLVADPQSLSPIRVFAKVRQPVALFQMDPENKFLRHVGWIESEEMVPIDISRFDPQQQQAVKAVLQDNDSKLNYISL